MSRTKREPADRTGTSVVQIATPPKIPLQSLEHVRREAARLYREARAGRIETADASRLSFMLQGIGKLIEAGSIERRIEALENPGRRLALPDDIEDLEVIANGQDPA